MPKITEEPLEALQVRLFKKDLDYLRLMFRGQFGTNRAIRTIVRAYVNQIKAGADKAIDESELEAVDEAET